MRIVLRYFDGCPSWRTAERRLREALGAAGAADAEVALERVEDHGSAVRLGFRGSPTILLDGADPFADTAAPVGLTCRLYPTPEGFQGTPTVEQLRCALAARNGG